MKPASRSAFRHATHEGPVTLFGEPMERQPTTYLAGCCPCAESARAANAAPKSKRRARRLIGPSVVPRSATWLFDSGSFEVAVEMALALEIPLLEQPAVAGCG